MGKEEVLDFLKEELINKLEFSMLSGPYEGCITATLTYPDALFPSRTYGTAWEKYIRNHLGLERVHSYHDLNKVHGFDITFDLSKDLEEVRGDVLFIRKMIQIARDAYDTDVGIEEKRILSEKL